MRTAKKSLSASELLEHSCSPELFLRMGLEKAGAFWKKVRAPVEKNVQEIYARASLAL
jgi:hypothetical protein